MKTFYQIDVRNKDGEYIAQDEVVERSNLMDYIDTIIDQADEISIVKNRSMRESTNGSEYGWPI